MNNYPFSPFFEILEDSGFRITIRDYRRISTALSASGPWTMPRLRSVLMSLLVRDEEQKEIFLRRFNDFFDVDMEPRIREIDFDLAVKELSNLAQADAGLKRRLEGRRVRRRIQEEAEKAKEKPKRRYLHVLLSILIAASVFLVIDTIVPLIEEKQVETGQTVTKTIESRPEPPEHRNRIYPDMPKIIGPVEKPRAAGDEWKVYAWIGAAFSLLLLAYGVYVKRAARIPVDKAPEYDPQAPRHFRLGRIGGELPPRLSDRQLDELADYLGYFKSVYPGKYLNISASVKSTVDRGGLPTAVFHRRKAVFTVLILEDARCEQAAWNPIAGELAGGLERRGVPVVYGTFENSPARFHTADGATHLLDDLEDFRKGYLLLIFSDGRNLHNRNDTFILESLSRWPMKAWMAMSEPRRLGVAAVRAQKAGIPVYPADPEGLARAMNRYVTERGLVNAEERPDDDAFSDFAFVATPSRVERILGDAHAWAMDCSMIQPVTIALADALRRKFHPHLCVDRFERLMALPKTSRSVTGIRFDDPVLAVLRKQFGIRRSAHDQKAVLSFLLEQLEAAKPPDETGCARMVWKYQYERVRLELAPETAISEMAGLAADESPIRDYIRTEMGAVEIPDEKGKGTVEIPLRIAPKDPASLYRLKKIAGREMGPLEGGLEIPVRRKIALAALLLLTLAAFGWMGKTLWLTEQPAAKIRIAAQGPADPGIRLQKKDGDVWRTAADLNPVSGVPEKAVREIEVKADAQYRLSVIKSGRTIETPLDPGVYDLEVAVEWDNQEQARCVETIPDKNLTVMRCPRSAEKGAGDFVRPSWRERVGEAAGKLRTSICILTDDHEQTLETADILLKTSSVDLVYQTEPAARGESNPEQALQHILDNIGQWADSAQIILLPGGNTGEVMNTSKGRNIGRLAAIEGPPPYVQTPLTQNWRLELNRLFEPAKDDIIRKSHFDSIQIKVNTLMGESGIVLARSREALRRRFSLTIQTKPEDAGVRIIEPETTYQPGVMLKPGDYRVEISKEGYETEARRVAIEDRDVQLRVRLIVKLRHEAVTVSSDEYIKKFNLTENRRPVRYIENEYKDNKDGTITDLATGLVWQQAGSSKTMPYKDASAYVEGLNKKKFAGYDDWRLPTVDELLSLVEPEKQSNGLYIDSVFDRNQYWCWSADRRAGGGAWNVGFNYGLVYWLIVDSSGYVRVCRP